MPLQGFPPVNYYMTEALWHPQVITENWEERSKK